MLKLKRMYDVRLNAFNCTYEPFDAPCSAEDFVQKVVKRSVKLADREVNDSSSFVPEYAAYWAQEAFPALQVVFDATQSGWHQDDFFIRVVIKLLQPPCGVYAVRHGYDEDAHFYISASFQRPRLLSVNFLLPSVHFSLIIRTGIGRL